MKQIIKNSSLPVSLIGSLIFAALSLPSVIIFNHGSTEGGWGGFWFFVGIALISLSCTFFVFWFLNRFVLKLKLAPKLLLVLLFSTVLFALIYPFYWVVIVRLLIYHIHSNIPPIGYFYQIFSGIVSMHLPITLIAISALYNDNFRKTKIDLINAEKLLAEGNLQKLIQQVDPHFLFNNLNILSALITEDPQKAVVFTEKLAEIYRQILKTQHEVIIPLDLELKLANDYFYLLSERFQSSLYFKIEYNNNIPLEELFIIPLSVQFLIENVVKHNILSQNDPIHIHLRVFNDHIIFSNNIIKKQVSNIVGVGLSNLNERNRLLSDKTLTILKGHGFFTVTVPLLKKLKETE